jgi:hypothetical protein
LEAFDMNKAEASAIAAEVGTAVARWRERAALLGLSGEIDRMSSAFEHDDLRAVCAHGQRDDRK